MIKFDDLAYARPDYEEINEKIVEYMSKLSLADSYDEYLKIFKDIIKIQNHIEEMYDYADIRNMRDSSDEYFSDEILFWNEYKPKFDLLFRPFFKECINSKFREKLNVVVPENFFNTIEYQLKISSDDIIELQRKENDLKSEYRNILREKILFDGEERNLAYISGLFSHSNRNIRKRAHDIVNDFYYEKQRKLDDLFFSLVSIRNEIAQILGFENYTIYSLYNLRRFGYNYADISKFRDNIIKYIIPLCKKMNDWKKEELGIEKIEYYDTIYFQEMPKPLYEGEDLLLKFGELLRGISEELYILYSDMLNNGYIDFETRDNKVNFAITNYLAESAFPVITGNFKNSYMDVKVASHEFGHAYQKYNASIKDKDFIISSLLKYPTFDVAEMFSFAMELISMNYVDGLFNQDDYKKYCFIKIYDLVNVLPYICLVDEFQEKIYSTSNLEKEKIREIWLSLSKKYGLERDNFGHINLDSGGYFYRQSHIILNPFYYIDYALSYFGAFAIADACDKDLKLFKEIGAVASYYPLNKLIKDYDMPNPFDEKSIKNISSILEKQLLKYKK